LAVEFKGEEFLYLVKIPDSDTPFRLFNQTGGSTDSDADEIELDTKDKTGSDYGKVTHNINVEGILTEGDEAVPYIKKAQRQKKFIDIIEVNTRTKETEEGTYMVASFNRTFANGDYATYSIDASLNGSIKEGELEELPEGAPDSEVDTGGDDEGNGVEG